MMTVRSDIMTKMGFDMIMGMVKRGIRVRPMHYFVMHDGREGQENEPRRQTHEPAYFEFHDRCHIIFTGRNPSIPFGDLLENSYSGES